MARSQNDDVTRADMDELLGFLDVLGAEGFQPVVKVHGGRATGKDGAIQMPYPEYTPVVLDFIKAASRSCWMDHGYDPSDAGELLRDADRVSRATLAELRQVITFIVRGERFCDGHWGAMIGEGYVRRVLERLKVLRDEVGEP